MADAAHPWPRAARFSLGDPVAARTRLERSEDVREPAALRQRWHTAKVLLVTDHGELPVDVATQRVRLRTVSATTLGDHIPAGMIFVGRLDGTDYWTVLTTSLSPHARHTDQLSQLLSDTRRMRAIAPLLTDSDAALATTAVALTRWHSRARYCTQCGRTMRSDFAGHTRRCAADHQEFPRIDPAVIMLVHDGRGNIVLGRQPSWDDGRYSVLAGFTEAGESLEQAVVREVREEVGIAVDEVQYLGSQPWPFPRSLMVAFSARACNDTVLTPRPGEIEQAQWFTTTQLRSALDAAAAPDKAAHQGNVILPSHMSIAYQMIDAYVHHD